MAHRPLTASGSPYDETAAEQSWKERAGPRKGSAVDGAEWVRQCLVSVDPSWGYRLSIASLALVPSDMTRTYLAYNAPWGHPEAAIRLFDGVLARRVPPSLRASLLAGRASRQCEAGRIEEARDGYRAAHTLRPACPIDLCYAFNLSCCMGDEAGALTDANRLAKIAGPSDPQVLEARDILREWRRQRSDDASLAARHLLACVSGKLPDVAILLSRVHT